MLVGLRIRSGFVRFDSALLVCIILTRFVSSSSSPSSPFLCSDSQRRQRPSRPRPHLPRRPSLIPSRLSQHLSARPSCQCHPPCPSQAQPLSAPTLDVSLSPSIFSRCSSSLLRTPTLYIALYLQRPLRLPQPWVTACPLRTERRNSARQISTSRSKRTRESSRKSAKSFF